MEVKKKQIKEQNRKNKKQNKREKKIKWQKKASIILVILLILFLVLPMTVTSTIYEMNFGSRVVLEENSGRMKYEDYQEKMTRREISFSSNKGQTLRGFVYTKRKATDEPKALIVIAHGYLGTHEEYLNQIYYFAMHGYEVMGYDNTGTNLSDGKSLIGLGQSAIDLDYALRYVENNAELKDKLLFLYGHSWGGYAVTSVLNYGHNVKAVVSKSGYNNSRDMLIEYGCNLYGEALQVLDPYVYLYEKIKFGDAIDLNGVKGINTSSDTRVLLLHSEDDPVISLENSLLVHKDEFVNPKRIKTILLKYKGHDVTRSEEAILYQEERKQEWNQIIEKYGKEADVPKEVVEKFKRSVNKEKNNELDETIMEEILAFYQESL